MERKQASIESATEAFRRLLTVASGGDVAGAANIQRELLSRFRINVKMAYSKPRLRRPAHQHVVEMPGCEPDGSPLELITVPQYCGRSGYGRKYVDAAIERGHVPHFRHKGNVLLHERTAERAIGKLSDETGLCALNGYEDRIPQLNTGGNNDDES